MIRLLRDFAVLFNKLLLHDDDDDDALQVRHRGRLRLAGALAGLRFDERVHAEACESDVRARDPGHAR